MKTFEHKIVLLTGKKAEVIELELNLLGKDGWELVTVSDQASGLWSRAFLKREVQK